MSGGNVKLNYTYFPKGGTVQNAGNLSVAYSKFIGSNSTALFHLGGTTNIASSTFIGSFEGLGAQGLGSLSFTNNIFTDNTTAVSLQLGQNLAITNSGNTATGTGKKGIFLTSSVGITSNLTLSNDGLPYVLYDEYSNSFTVSAGKTLTINPGTVVKFGNENTSLIVLGTLNVLGNSLNPAYFTSYNDDALGGDTDGGSSATNISHAGYIDIRTGGKATLIYSIFPKGGSVINTAGTLTSTYSRFTGSIDMAVYHLGGTTNIASSTFIGNLEGLNAGGSGSLSFTNNIFTDNTTAVILQLSQGLTFTNSGNTATGTGKKGIFLSSSTGITSNLILANDGIPYVISEPYSNTFTVSVGKTLTVRPGAVIKFETGNITIAVLGTLRAVGTSALPIYLTSFDDDSLEGDTDGGSTASYISHAGYIDIRTGGKANLSYVIFPKGGTVINTAGTLTSTYSKFTESIDTAVYHLGGTTNIASSTFIGNVGGSIRNDTTGTLSAKNNYFGSPTGPTHPTNPLGVGDIIGDNIIFVPFLTKDPVIYGPLTLTNLGETEDDGNQDTKGVADYTKFTFTAVISGTKTPPASVTLYVGTTPYVVSPDQNGVYTLTKTFPKGTYSYYFRAKVGVKNVASATKTFKTGYSNVAFLPGIMGSRLYRVVGGYETQIWEPGIYPDNDNTQLLMKPSGVSALSGIYAKDVIDASYTRNVYKSFLSQLTTLKTQKTIADWRSLPYDWRYGADTIVTSPKSVTGIPLDTELKNLALTSDTGKVTIVAHSYGGLVAKALSNKLGTASSTVIDQMIFVAVPQVGTPQAVGAILHGFDQGLPFDWMPALITKTEARTIAQNMPMSYNLLPSNPYFAWVKDPIITFSTTSPLLAPWRDKYGTTIKTGAGLKKFMTDLMRLYIPVNDILNDPAIGNSTLYTRANTLHSSLDTWTPPKGVQLTEIAGWGVDTVRTIEYSESAGNLIYSPKMVIDGDGTVVVPSALWTPLSSGVKKYWVDLYDYNYWSIDRKHADIFEVENLRTFIQNTFIRSISPLPTYIHSSTEETQKIYMDKRLRFTLHSPLTLGVSDDKGNYTGISETGEILENIPGSSYQTFGEVQYISVPSSANIDLDMNGYKDGSFSLEIEEVSGNTVLSKTTFSGISSTRTTKVKMHFPKGKGIEGASSLSVDYEGKEKKKREFSAIQGAVVTQEDSIVSGQ